MGSLSHSIVERWEYSTALCKLIPWQRVFAGRIPQTELYKFPYVSVLCVAGGPRAITDKSIYTTGPVSFHIWVDDARLEFGYDVAEAIRAVFANQCWSLGDGSKVITCLDEGEPDAHQTDLPAVHAWEVVKLVTVCLERPRAASTGGCCDESSSSEESIPSYSDSSYWDELDTSGSGQ